MALKITEADKWFGRCIKERAGWCCEVCGKGYEEGAQGLHTSHFWSRRHQSVRHDPNNAAAQCFGCHQALGGDPVEFAAWARRYLGAKRFLELARRKNKILRIKRYEKDIATHYKATFESMKRCRANGYTGRLEFVGWSDGSALEER